MKKSFFPLLIAISVFCSCQKEEHVPEGMKALSFTAVTSNGRLWNNSDVIAVYDGLEINEFKLKSGAGTNAALFKGCVEQTATEFSAVYPYDAGYLDSSDEFVADIPAEQVVGTSTSVVESAKFYSGESRVSFALVGKSYDFYVPQGYSECIIHTADGSFLAGTSKFIKAQLPENHEGNVSIVVNKDANTSDLNVFHGINGKYFKSDKEIVAIWNLTDYTSFMQNPVVDKEAYIMNDIDFESDGSVASEGFVPAAEFCGVLDGQMCCLYNALCYYTNPASEDGVYGGIVCVLNGGTVRNIILGSEDGENWDEVSGVQFSTRDGILYGGSIAGEIRNGAKIEGCKNFTYVMPNGQNQKYDNFVGGIAGKATGTPSYIIDCANMLEVRDNDKGKECSCLAGILAVDDAGCVIDGCSNCGEVISNNKACLVCAGIVAIQNGKGTISNCRNEGRVYTVLNYTSTPFIGGIVGRQTSAEAVISKCINSGKVECSPNQLSTSDELLNFVLGGIAADASGIIEDCTNSGGILFQHKGTGYRGAATLGGIVGGDLVPAKITGCVNTGAITHSKAAKIGYLGGIIGHLMGTSTVIENCSNKGQLYTNRGVSGVRLGGLVGEINNDNTAAMSGFLNCSVDCEILMDNSSAKYEKAGMIAGACSNPSNINVYTFGFEGKEITYFGTWNKTAVSQGAPHFIGADYSGSAVSFVAKYQK